MAKKTLVTGQDESYVADFPLEKGYEVHGLIRRARLFNTGRINHLYTDPHEHGARRMLHYTHLATGSRFVTLTPLHPLDPRSPYGARQGPQLLGDTELTRDIWHVRRERHPVHTRKPERR